MEFIILDDLEEKTIHLAKLVREAMIYLSFIVHDEEKKKNIDNLSLINLETKYE